MICGCIRTMLVGFESVKEGELSRVLMLLQRDLFAGPLASELVCQLYQGVKYEKVSRYFWSSKLYMAISGSFKLDTLTVGVASLIGTATSWSNVWWNDVGTISDIHLLDREVPWHHTYFRFSVNYLHAFLRSLIIENVYMGGIKHNIVGVFALRWLNG